MFKLNSNKQRTFVSVVVIALVMWFLCKQTSRSGYAPLTLSKEPQCDIRKLQYGMECVPGPQADASPYTKNLTPGGVCGIQECVNAQAGEYEIGEGIGGSLLN
jgi:hypothetical protein